MSKYGTLHVMLNQLYPNSAIRIDEKKRLAMEFSQGRTEHTSELSDEEFKRLINSLREVLKRGNQKLSAAESKLFALRNSLGWSYERLSEFIIEQTQGKRTHSRQLNADELNKIISVMEKIEAHNYRRKLKR